MRDFKRLASKQPKPIHCVRNVSPFCQMCLAYRPIHCGTPKMSGVGSALGRSVFWAVGKFRKVHLLGSRQERRNVKNSLPSNLSRSRFSTHWKHIRRLNLMGARDIQKGSGQVRIVPQITYPYQSGPGHFWGSAVINVSAIK